MSVDTSHGSQEMDYEAHEKTYENFVKATKYIVGFIAVMLVLMAIFLV